MIRQSKIEDAKAVIKLLYLAMDDMIYDLTGQKDLKSAFLVYEDFFKMQKNRLSFENTYVYVKNNEIVGVIVVYDGNEIKSLDSTLNENIQKLGLKYKILPECDSSDVYLDSLAVDERFRGRGIAKELINFAFEIAAKRHKPLSLLVEQNNKTAQAVYDKLGFEFSKNKILYSHLYFYLKKRN